METPRVLYRGSREKIDTLKPQPLLESEKNRFPAGAESVVFASQYKEDALAYAIGSRAGLGGFTLLPYWKNKPNNEIGWKLELACKETDLKKDELVHIYEINPEGFSQNMVGEWYSTRETKPLTTQEITVGEALSQFDEVKFTLDPEVGIVTEGNGMRL